MDLNTKYDFNIPRFRLWNKTKIRKQFKSIKQCVILCVYLYIYIFTIDY